MRSRDRLVALLVLCVAAVTAASAAGQPASVKPGYYVVRPDPRLCPSPLCGGYWVALANHARTRCADGLLRPRCYVARAVNRDGQPLASAIRNEALVRGGVGPGRDDLGVLVVTRVFSPVGRAAAAGSYYRLVDTGVRCIRAPCFSVRAWRLNRPDRTAVSAIDVGAAPADVRARIEAALGSKDGMLVRGRIVPIPGGGRVFRASRFFLASER